MSIKEHARKVLKKSLYHSAYSRSFYALLGIVLKEVQVSFKQFYTWNYPLRSLLRVISIILSALARLLLGRSLKYSYAFTGEDKLIEGILKPQIRQEGIYIDVGCNHPKFLSNTYGLYRKGWKGICIDANKDLINKYRFFRPKDIAIHALVSNQIEERDFYVSENDVLSTTEKTNLGDIKKLGLNYETKKLKPRLLTSILKENSFQEEIDLLSIDAEEHDYNVLLSLDFNIYSPKLIIVEDESFNPSDYNKNPFYNLLKEKGYEVEGFVLKNVFYLKKHPEP